MVLSLFFLGLFSSITAAFYLVAMIIYVFGESNYPGLIAFTPKWIFFFIFFVFLGKTKRVQRNLEKLENLIFK